MLTDAENHAFEVILVADLSRLSRDAVEPIQTIEELDLNTSQLGPFI